VALAAALQDQGYDVMEACSFRSKFWMEVECGDLKAAVVRQSSPLFPTIGGLQVPLSICLALREEDLRISRSTGGSKCLLQSHSEGQGIVSSHPSLMNRIR